MLRKDGMICFRRCLPSSASLPSPLASKRGATEGQIDKRSLFLGVYFSPFFFLLPETQPACHFLIRPSLASLSHTAEPGVLKHRREPLHASLLCLVWYVEFSERRISSSPPPCSSSAPHTSAAIASGVPSVQRNPTLAGGRDEVSYWCAEPRHQAPV